VRRRDCITLRSKFAAPLYLIVAHRTETIATGPDQLSGSTYASAGTIGSSTGRTAPL
jgi:hypothetical protein